MCQSGTGIFSSLEQICAGGMPAESFWVCGTPALPGSEEPLWCWPHQHRGGKSANSHCEPGNPGLQSLSPGFWHIHGCRDAMGGSWAVPKTWKQELGTAGGMFYLFQRRDIASDPPVFPQPIYVCLCGQNKINFIRHPLTFPIFSLKWFYISFPCVYTLGWSWKEWTQRNPTNPCHGAKWCSFTPELSLELHFALEKLPAIFH